MDLDIPPNVFCTTSYALIKKNSFIIVRYVFVGFQNHNNF